MPGRDGRAGGAGGDETDGGLHLHLPRRGQEEDDIGIDERHERGAGATERRDRQQGGVLGEVQARRERVQGAVAQGRGGRGGAGRLRRLVGAAHHDGERRQNLPPVGRLHGRAEGPAAHGGGRGAHDGDGHAERPGERHAGQRPPVAVRTERPDAGRDAVLEGFYYYGRPHQGRRQRAAHLREPLGGQRA